MPAITTKKQSEQAAKLFKQEFGSGVTIDGELPDAHHTDTGGLEHAAFVLSSITGGVFLTLMILSCLEQSLEAPIVVLQEDLRLCAKNESTLQHPKTEQKN